MSETNPVNEEVNVDLFDTQSILAELLAISNQNASNSRFRSSNKQSTVEKKKGNSESLGQTKQQQQQQRQQRQQKRNQTDDSNVENQNFEIENNHHHDLIKRNNDGNAGEFFVEQYEEKSEMNQYWYSPATIQVLCDAMIEIKSLSDGRCSTEVTNTFKIAFLSTPSLYFALPIELRKHCNLFDIDPAFQNDSGFIHYNFEDPENIPTSLKNQFDMVVIDPPFVARDVWVLYQKATLILLKHDLKNESTIEQNTTTIHTQRSFILATTIAENESLMEELFHAKPSIFKPNIPNLIYQYKVYVNCVDECETLKTRNLELHE